MCLLMIGFIAFLSCLAKVSTQSQPGFCFVSDTVRFVAGSEYDWTSREDRVMQQTQRTPRHHELTMGKDRELFSFSLDLKWLFSKVIDPACWVSTIATLGSQISPFKTGPEYEYQAKENSLEIYSYIRRLSRSSFVKVFGGTLREAQEYCVMKNRFLVLYIEDKVDEENMICRKTLADNIIGSVVNDQFVLYVGSARHYPTWKFAKSIGAKSFPYFAILHVPVSLRNNTLMMESPEVLGSLNLGKDLRPDKILRFFHKALEFHATALVEDKKILLKAESIGAEFLQESTKVSIMERGIQFFRKKNGIQTKEIYEIDICKDNEKADEKQTPANITNDRKIKFDNANLHALDDTCRKKNNHR